MRTEKIINSISIVPGVQQVVGISEILYGIACACFHAFQKASPVKNLLLRRDIRIIARGFLRCIPLIGTIFSIILLKRECQRPPSKSESIKPIQKILSEIQDTETKKAYIEAVSSILNNLHVDDNPSEDNLRFFNLFCFQIAAQAERLNFTSLSDLKQTIKANFKENFKKFKSGNYPSKLLGVIDSTENLTGLLLVDLQLDYGMRMKSLRKSKYAHSPNSNFDKDWHTNKSKESLEKILEGFRLIQTQTLFKSSEFSDCVIDLFELVTSANVQAITTTFYLSFMDKNKFLEKNIKQTKTTTMTLSESDYNFSIDQRNLPQDSVITNEFLENKKFVSKSASELHFESIDYTMEIGEVKEDGFRLFQKGYLVYTLASPMGKMVRFELPIDLTSFNFESEVGVSESIQLMLQFFYNANKAKKENIEKYPVLKEASRGKSDIENLLNNYGQISTWAKNTAEQLSSLYEKIYLSLGETTPLPSIQNLDDEMPLYFISKLCVEDNEIKTAYHNYLAQLNLMKLAVIEKQPISEQSILHIDQLKSALLEKIPEEHSGYISHYLNTEIQNVYGRKRPHLNELIKQCQLFLGEDVLSKEVRLALMNKKIARDLLSFIRSAIAVREENSKAEEVDLEKYHNQRLLTLKEELEQLIASQFPAETDKETLKVCSEFLQELYNRATLQDA